GASIRLSHSLVPKVTVASALHDGLRARELYVGIKPIGHGEVRAADQQESELRLAQLLVELSVPASRNIDLEGILRLLAHSIIERVLAGECCERRRHDLPEVLLILRPPELFAVATIDVAQGPSNEGVRSLLAQFCLQGLHERNQDLSLAFGLLNDGNVHAHPLALGTVCNSVDGTGFMRARPSSGNGWRCRKMKTADARRRPCISQISQTTPSCQEISPAYRVDRAIRLAFASSRSRGIT